MSGITGVRIDNVLNNERSVRDNNASYGRRCWRWLKRGILEMKVHKVVEGLGYISSAALAVSYNSGDPLAAFKIFTMGSSCANVIAGVILSKRGRNVEEVRNDEGSVCDYMVRASLFFVSGMGSALIYPISRSYVT
ncbi:MAG: hypothetical protein P4L16_07475 [Chlamydiales bacterium]|nr:hypothetical protein [Chlamydiales bacterium]